MDNIFNYHQEDFTEDNYKNLLKLAKNNYIFKSFSDFKSDDYIVIWRHDIDFSVHRALKLAQIENSEGIKSIYFLQLNCEFYNVLETTIKNKIKEILALGHSIGLHFDPTAYNISNKEDLEHHLSFEKKILEQLFKKNLEVFSFHNPTPDITKYDSFKLSGMINTYAKIFQDEFGYCSDSNGYWRHDRLEDVLKSKEHKKLQILTHPEWWQKEIMEPRARIQRCIIGRARATETSYDALLEQHGRKNIGA